MIRIYNTVELLITMGGALVLIGYGRISGKTDCEGDFVEVLKVCAEGIKLWWSI